jgi:hypothetical protein
MNLEHVTEQLSKQIASLADVQAVDRENPEPMSLSESSADIFVRRLIVTWSDGSKYRVEVRPTP